MTQPSSRRLITETRLTAELAEKADSGDYATNADLATGLGTKVNSSTYTAGLAAKQNTASLAADVASHVSDGSALDTALKTAFDARSPAATYTYEAAPDGSKRIKTEAKGGITMTYAYDDTHGGRVAKQSDGTTTWTFAYDSDSLITGVAA